jgi:predicted kinase
MKLIIFSGLPGTGKSTLAEAVGKYFGIPVFAKDWIEASLLQSGLTSTKNNRSLGYASYELLTRLAERQLMLGQSVILDSVAATKSIRSEWGRLAKRYQAERRVIECVCLDESIHKARLKVRRRRIPGWHELEWAEVERVKGYYVPWRLAHLTLDMVKPFDENLAMAKAYCERFACEI